MQPDSATNAFDRPEISWSAAPVSLLVWLVGLGLGPGICAADPAILKPAALAYHLEAFNSADDETVTNYITNARSGDWLRQNIPLFECPDREVEELYYFRWWTFRKHVVHTPRGFVLTEFLTPVRHAGAFNTISCAAGLHLAEGRWLRDGRYLDDYTRFWLRGPNGKPQPHFHNFSSWFAAAVYDRYLVNGDKRFVTRLLPDLVTDYRQWEKDRQLTNGLFWQYDVRDGMEESISGSRTEKNLRPTINSYMFANARAIAAIARLANQPKLASEFTTKASELKRLTQAQLWDTNASFFKVRLAPASGIASGPDGLSSAREAIGFIPWMFGLPDLGKNYEAAWAQFTDLQGFRAPAGLTTAERRHPQFRSHGIGTCEWDGAVWPFATTQTLAALANVLHDYPQSHVTAADYFDAFLAYTRNQHANGKPYVGEYLDEVTGDWINRTNRSANYNHSTYADLLITGIIGLRPRADDIVELHPLLPEGVWDWFCLDGINYHGRRLTILWDRTGERYQHGQGLLVLCNGREVARGERLAKIAGRLPK